MPTLRPAQHQSKQPGLETKMWPRPVYISPNYKSALKLKNKVAFITGGDSGIGRAVACAFAMEGADVIIQYLNEHEDALETQAFINETGRECLLLPADLKSFRECEKVFLHAQKKFSKIHILVNNVGEQYPEKSIEDISYQQLESTFKINFFSYFAMTKNFVPQAKKNDVIINTASVTAYKGNEQLIDYSSTKGAIISFTRSLSQSLVKKGIRVNAVAPGPIWTPLIPSSFTAKQVAQFGKQVPMKRAGQPAEIAPAYVFLASSDASYMTGQVLHPNGGVIVNG